MKHRLTALVGCAVVSVISWQIVSAASPAHPVRLSSNEAAAVLKEIEKDPDRYAEVVAKRSDVLPRHNQSARLRTKEHALRRASRGQRRQN